MKDSFKQSVRSWLPPALSRLKATLFSSEISFNGDFPEWNDALAVTSGYDADGILKKAAKAAKAVASGNAVFERDSVLFDEIQYSWPVLAGLLKAAADERGHLRVLDFGGALGSSYYQNRKFLEQLQEVKWGIVEQDNFVECGKREFETDVLKFFHSIEEAAKTCEFNVILLSSVLPYLKDPYNMLAQAVKLGTETVIIDRTPVLPGNADRLTVQKIPDTIYHASYPAWFFSEEKLLNFMGEKYSLLVKFDTLGGEVRLRDPVATAMTKGYIFSLKETERRK
ncbi:MAG: methyltransferase, TIGR04325 family [Victivallaceae bacterium]